MTAELSDELKKHLDNEKVFATMATIGRDGQPHLTVNWIERDGDELLYSTTVSRQQYKNLARDPRITVLINPPETPYVYAQIRGTVTITADPAREMPDRLSLEYTGKPYAEFNPASVEDADRVTVRITPTKVLGRF
ncbi:PPOX class F420-dependent oxidoreductase [Nocardia wallacei]|uniref:PPOX class F420-dependent oxidoreductase n=1 Tax=Nocardia wallacei TaxID=480035 RepID=UPI002456F02E|nr:PPOX class F420-dependent oxidoreductase [Nocardia wallacei]